MFTPRIMVIKMSKMAHEGKKLVTLWAKYLRTPEKSYSAISDNSTVDRLWSYHS